MLCIEPITRYENIHIYHLKKILNIGLIELNTFCIFTKSIYYFFKH